MDDVVVDVEIVRAAALIDVLLQSAAPLYVGDSIPAEVHTVIELGNIDAMIECRHAAWV